MEECVQSLLFQSHQYPGRHTAGIVCWCLKTINYSLDIVKLSARLRRTLYAQKERFYTFIFYLTWMRYLESFSWALIRWDMVVKKKGDTLFDNMYTAVYINVSTMNILQMSQYTWRAIKHLSAHVSKMKCPGTTKYNTMGKCGFTYAHYKFHLRVFTGIITVIVSGVVNTKTPWDTRFFFDLSLYPNVLANSYDLSTDIL